MTRHVTISYSTLPGTAAGVARTGGAIVIADRRAGVAGGEGLGANGAQLLAASVGGCFWNDLHSIGERLGLPVAGAGVEVEVEVVMAGQPSRVVRIEVEARLPASAHPVFDAACAETIIGQSLMAAFPVQFRMTEIG